MGLMMIGMTGLALQTYGNVMGAMTQDAQGKSAQNMADYNAEISMREKHMIEQRGKGASIQQAEMASRRESTMLAKMGKSGVVTQTGSPLEILEEQGVQSEAENLGIGYDTQVAASQAESQAGLHTMQGKIYREKGKNLRNAGYISTAQTLLFGAPGQKSGGMTGSTGTSVLSGFG